MTAAKLKAVKILGREINSAAQHKQKSMGSPVWSIWQIQVEFVKILLEEPNSYSEQIIY